MRLSSPRAPDVAALLPLLLLAASPLGAAFKCDQVTANDESYDLSKLSGAHSLVVSRPQAASFHNTTYTLDICRSLKRKDDVPKEQQCPDGSRVCAITRVVGKEDPGHGTVDEVFPLAGALEENGGGSLEPQVSKLEDANPDNSGLRLVMKGGFHQKEGQDKPRSQQTIIDFICDQDREGTEGEYDAPDKYDDGDGPLSEDAFMRTRAEDGKDDDKQPHEIQLGEGKNASLVFQKYGPSDSDPSIDILQLKWRTKHACRGQSDGGSGGSGSNGASWGFFTWLVIIVFFGTAAYLIFGSWLNYNRYGARGWDLLPHGDTIRDIPYLLKDWTRRVLNTVQGSGSRGGYSAV